MPVLAAVSSITFLQKVLLEDIPSQNPTVSKDLTKKEKSISYKLSMENWSFWRTKMGVF